MDVSHQRQVEHDAVVVGPEPGGAMSAAADREIHAGVAGEVHRSDDIGDLLRLDDDPRVPIEHAVMDGAGFVVSGILRRDDRCPDLLTKLIDRWRTHHALPSGFRRTTTQGRPEVRHLNCRKLQAVPFADVARSSIRKRPREVHEHARCLR